MNGRFPAESRFAWIAADACSLSPKRAAGIRTVKGVKKLGVRLGNWRKDEEVCRSVACPDPVPISTALIEALT